MMKNLFLALLSNNSMLSFLLIIFVNLAHSQSLEFEFPVQCSFAVLSDGDLTTTISLNDCSSLKDGGSEISECDSETDPLATSVVTLQYSEKDCTGNVTSSEILTNVHLAPIKFHVYKTLSTHKL